MSHHALYLKFKDMLQGLYAHRPDLEPFLVKTLAMMLTGMLLGPHVQLFAIAMCIPVAVKLPSLVRRLERFVADERVEVHTWFEPFVLAMIACLGNETAYLVIDCTQAGPKCRTLFVGLCYHFTVLPLVWKTYPGHKGHIKGQHHRELLEQLYPHFRLHRRVIVLGDAEFSNEPVITWLLAQGWDFVLRFQSNYLIQTHPQFPWQSAQALYEAAQLQPGQVRHWEQVSFTQAHQTTGLTMTVQWGEREKEPLCLISTLLVQDQPHLVYDRRYWVETLFGNCKSRGFQLARTEMTTPEHIDRLVLAITIATCITLGLGTHLIVIQHTDQVDRADRRDLSLFQLGWRWLFRLVALNRLHELKIVFRWNLQLPPAGFHPAV